MRKTKKWESLVWIVIGIAILSFTILWIINIISYSINLIDAFEKNTRMSILRDNISHIINQLDTSNLAENEIFYIYKNSSGSEFQIFTWTLNTEYKYIDENGNKVDDIVNFSWAIYSRVLWLTREYGSDIGIKNQIVRASIKRLIRK